MDPLSRLFGSPARLKLLRLFLFNEDVAITAPEAAFRSKLSKEAARKEINVLVASGVIRKKTAGKTAYQASRKFPHYDALQQFSNVIVCLEKASAGILPPDLAISQREINGMEIVQGELRTGVIVLAICTRR